MGEEIVRIMGVRIPTQDEINHIQEEVSIDDDNSPAPENIPREPTSSNIFDDRIYWWDKAYSSSSFRTYVSQNLCAKHYIETVE